MMGKKVMAGASGVSITSPNHPDRLMLYDMGDTTSGSTQFDSSPNGKDGVMNNLAIVAGTIGNALQYNNPGGSTASIDRLARSAGYGSSSTWTFHWFSDQLLIPPAGTHITSAYIFDQQTPRLIILMQTNPLSSPVVTVQVFDGSSFWDTGVSSEVGNGDFHWGVTYDGTRAKLYRSGIAVADSGVRSFSAIGTTQTSVGARFAAGTLPPNDWNSFHGKIDQFGIISGARSAAEMAQLAAET